MEETKYPKIHVKLTGKNGNALNLIGIVRNALRKHGVSREEISLFSKEATSGDYDNVLQTCMRWVNVS